MAASKEDDLCLVTNLPRYRCDHCIGADAPALARAQVSRTTTTTARYPGRCAYCNDPIRPGDRIRRVADTMDWIHASHDLDA